MLSSLRLLGKRSVEAWSNGEPGSTDRLKRFLLMLERLSIHCRQANIDFAHELNQIISSEDIQLARDVNHVNKIVDYMSLELQPSSVLQTLSSQIPEYDSCGDIMPTLQLLLSRGVHVSSSTELSVSLSRLRSLRTPPRPRTSSRLETSPLQSMEKGIWGRMSQGSLKISK